jgi:hypothetical protein
MFFEEDRIKAVREMICADDRGGPQEGSGQDPALCSRATSRAMYAGHGRPPVTIRYLDPPLHEFLPTKDEDIAELAAGSRHHRRGAEEHHRSLHEFNPMMGHRGCRLAVTYPEIAEMQTNAVIKAAINVKKRRDRQDDHPEIMIPLVGEVKELKFVKDVIVVPPRQAHRQGRREASSIQVGTMIEIPRAALTADEIAEGGRVLQLRHQRPDPDDLRLQPRRRRQVPRRLLRQQDLRERSVRSIWTRTAWASSSRWPRATARDPPRSGLGICGEHGGDPSSIEFCHNVGLDYVSCSPFRVPIARLAAAQALCAAICSVCSNCFFNYLFIFGGFGFPRLGVRGAAIGTVIASFVNVAVIASAVIKYKIPFVLEIRRHFKWTREFLGIYLRKCLPVICNEFFIGVGNMMINIVLGRQSEQAIAAVAVFRTLEGIIISFFTGFSNAASVLIGKEVGAGNHEVAYQRGIRLVYLCSALIGCACLMLIALHVPMLHAMGLHGESFGICTGMLLIFSVVALLRMGNWAQNDTFRAAGDPLFGSVMEITFMFLMVQPLIYSANFYFKAPFLLVFALCYADEPIRYVIMQRHLYSGKWIRPVSDAGEATIADFRHRHGIKLRGRDS